VFKSYVMGQLQLPADLEELMPEEHLVRVVEAAMEQMNLEPLLRRYKGGGASSYHPKMMLKVLVYAYSQRIYSSRQIAKALRENVYFMWISGNSRPDFRTLNRFRGEVMRGVVEPVFSSVLELLIEAGYVKLEHYFLDGTKIEANANRYSWVWAKSTKRYQEKLQEHVKKLLDEIEQVNEEENEEYGERDLEEMGEGGPIDAERLKKKIQELNQRLEEDPQDEKLAKAVKRLQEDYLPRQKKYEEQQTTFKGRNSYSKTDVDATFMRMKEDHMKNGQLKPGYNVQIGTEHQFVVGFSLHQRPADSGCLIPHLEGLKAQLGRQPECVIADAGYGSEENYAYLEQAGLQAYVKYNTFHQELKKRKQDRFRAASFAYDERRDEFICPADRRLTFRGLQSYRSENGSRTELRIYECGDCSQCALKPQCTQAAGNRWIRISFRWRELQEKARDKLLSEQGKVLRSRRLVEAESVFARLKHNWGFRRFLLRGQDKVKVEWGLLCMAHNLAKVAAL
jgi:transposase